MQEIKGVTGRAVTLSILAAVALILALTAPFGAGATASIHTVYDDALAAGWSSWSWNTTSDYTQSSTVQTGTAALAASHDAAWAGLYLHSNELIDTSGADALRFWIHGGSSTRQIQVSLADAGNTLHQALPVEATAGSWQQVDLPLANLGNLASVSGIVWQEATGSAQPTFYLDNIAFVSSSASPTATATGTGNDGGNTSTGNGPALTVDLAGTQGPISPQIYGVNFQDAQYAAELNIPVKRWGGNATTRYNWQLDVANRASDWYFENIPNENDNPALLPHGSTSDQFVEANIETGTDSLLTVPLIGWTPKSRTITCGFSVAKYGPQQNTDVWRPDCGNGVRTDGSLITGNDPTDTSVAVDPGFVQDWIRHLTAKYGSAAEGGVRFYNLDNEPMLWHETHRDVHPEGASYDEIRDLTYQYGAAVKEVDPDAQLLGPAVWGWTAYFYSGLDSESGNWTSPPDRGAHGGTPFVPWYLQQMAAYEQQYGQRILDYLDLHYYVQGGGVSLAPAGDANTKALRLRSTRSLWDPTYTDESWIGEPVQLIPRMRAWTEDHYPGTKLAITEYNWGGHEDINGALAQADVLGIFGREGLDLATLWAPPALTEPAAYAFRIYRNYDGAGSTFGDVRLAASSSDQEQLAVYAARRSADGATTIVVVNKSGTTLSSDLQLQGLAAAATAEVYRYSPANLGAIVREADQVIEGGRLSAGFPADSITLFVLPGDGSGATAPTPTATATAAPTETATPAPTTEPTLQPTATATPLPTTEPTATPQPVATPTTQAAASAHIGDLDGMSSNLRNTWEALVTVQVVDGSGRAVSGATVGGQWSDGEGSASCTTDGSGTCQVTSPTLRKKNSSITFAVSGIAHDTLPYAPGANEDPDGDSDGSTITVFK